MVEICTAEAIINIEFRIAEALAFSIICEDLSLRRDLSRGLFAKNIYLQTRHI
jgi:hypothetical protein